MYSSQVPRASNAAVATVNAILKDGKHPKKDEIQQVCSWNDLCVCWGVLTSFAPLQLWNAKQKGWIDNSKFGQVLSQLVL
jgi:hypothetical protein